MENRASVERRAEQIKKQELSDPKINEKSVKMASKQSSVPRVSIIIDKGKDYEKRREESLKKRNT